MSTPGPETGCERWDDELATYALGALPSAEADALQAHLAGCQRCARRLEWLMPAVDLLPASVEQLDPPARLKQRLMEAVEEEAAEREAAPGRDGGAADRARSRLLRALGLPTLRPLLVAVAAVCVIAAGIGGYLLGSGEGDARTVAVNSVAPQTEIGGELEIRGDEAVLTLSNLPLVGEDEVFQTWLEPEGGGELEPAAPFVRDGKRRGHAVIEEQLEGTQRILVTREPAYAGDPPQEASTPPIAIVDLR